MTKKTTSNGLRDECKRLGASDMLDADNQCSPAIAPAGQRFEPDLHELVAVFGSGFLGNGATRADARADLAYRLRGYAALESCDELCSTSYHE